MFRLLSMLAVFLCFATARAQNNFDVSQALMNADADHAVVFKNSPKPKLTLAPSASRDYQLDTNTEKNFIWNKQDNKIYYATSEANPQTGEVSIGEVRMEKNNKYATPNSLDEVQITETEKVNGQDLVKEILNCQAGSWKNYVFQRDTKLGDCIKVNKNVCNELLKSSKANSMDDLAKNAEQCNSLMQNIVKTHASLRSKDPQFQSQANMLQQVVRNAAQKLGDSEKKSDFSEDAPAPSSALEKVAFSANRAVLAVKLCNKVGTGNFVGEGMKGDKQSVPSTR